MSEINSIWETVDLVGNDDISCFKLQKKMSLLSDSGYIFRMKHTFQSILQPQSERSWRIVCHIKDSDIIVSSSQGMEYTFKCWKMIRNHCSRLLLQLELLDTERDQQEFIETKMKSLLVTERIPVNIDKYLQQSHFNELFQDLIPINHSTILTWYACSFSKKQQNYQGWMYILSKFLCFYSYYFGNETKWIIELKNIILIKKTKAFLGFLDNSIMIKTLDDIEYYISNLFHRNEAYDLIHQLCHDALHEKMASISMSPLQGSSSSVISNSTEINQGKKVKLFQEFFHLPNDEQLRIQQAIPCKCSRDETSWLQGYSYLSDHYFCFVAVPTSYEIRMVLPLYLVKKLEKFSNDKERSLSWLKVTILSLNSHESEIYIYITLGFVGSSDQDIYQNQFHLTLQENSLFTKVLLKNYKEANILDWELPKGFGENYGYPTVNQDEDHCSFNSLLITSIGDLRSLLINQKGFSNSKRGWIWSFLCGSWFKYIHGNAIISLSVQDNNIDPVTKLILDDIEKDLHRSLPEYIAFREGNSNGLELLRRVLIKCAIRNPDLGYCQAMNLLASVLLIYMNEEMTVYTLEKLCDSYFPEYFSTSMTGAVTDQHVFLSLIEENLPILYEHFKKHHIDISMISTSWFLSAYITQLSISLVPCMLDWLFLEGNKILFQLGLATLKLNGNELMQVTEAGDVMNLLRGFFEKFKIHDIEFHKWIGYARREYEIDQKRLRELRELHQLAVIHYIDDLYKQTHVRAVLDRVGFERQQLEYLFQQYQTILYYKNEKYDKDMLLKELFSISFPSWARFDVDDNDSIFVLERLRYLVETQTRISNNEIMQQSITFQQIILAIHQLVLLEGSIEERISSFCSSIVSYNTDQDYWVSLSRVILFIGRNMNHLLYNELQTSISRMLASALSVSNSEMKWIIDYITKDKNLKHFFEIYLPKSFLSRTSRDIHGRFEETNKNILDQVDEFLSHIET